MKTKELTVGVSMRRGFCASLGRRFPTMLLAAACLVSSFSGCGGDPNASPPPTVDNLRHELQSAIETGEGGSALTGVKDSLQAIESSHPDLHKKLSEQFEVLWFTNDKKEIKKIAQEMLDEVNAVN